MTKIDTDKVRKIEETFECCAYVPETEQEAELIMYKEACSAYEEREQSANKLLKEKDAKIAKLTNTIKEAMDNYEELSQVTKVFIKLCEGTADIGLYVALGSTRNVEGIMNMFCGIFTSEEAALRKILKDHNDKISESSREKYNDHYYIDKQTDVVGEHELMFSHTFPNGETQNRYIMTINIEKIDVNEVY